MIYRPDIQVLRGVAVLVVVLFHLGAPGFERGFLGVDAFFVVSGFLMALLCKEGATADFFSRRARRLLPAYFATVLATVIGSVFLTLPGEQRQVVEQGLFATSFASNVGFWLQNSYFSKANFTPLLHLWSLGVEIQFYLIVPALVMLQNRFRWTWPVLLVGSLLACFLMVNISPKTSFFMMPLRLWEFLIGACVARYMVAPSGPVRQARPLFGLASLALMLAVFFLPIDGQATNPLTGHPGAGALVICLATGGVLGFGLPSLGLAGRALVWLGDRSYSIYLAHFPVIVFGLYQPFSGTILAPDSIWQSLGLLAATAVASLLLFHGFERRRSPLGSFRGAATAAVVVAVACPASALAANARLSGAEARIMAALDDRAEYRCGKLFRILHPAANVCELPGGPDNGPAILLVGDSHADSIKTSFARVAHAKGYRVLFTVSNNPLISSPNGVALAKVALREDVAGVVLHFSKRLDPADDLPEFLALLKASDRPVAWLLPVPTYEQSVPGIVWAHRKEGPSIRRPLTDQGERAAFSLFATTHGVSAFDATRPLCDTSCRLVDDEMRPLYFDNGHLTLTGARLLEPVIAQAIGALAPDDAGVGEGVF